MKHVKKEGWGVASFPNDEINPGSDVSICKLKSCAYTESAATIM